MATEPCANSPHKALAIVFYKPLELHVRALDMVAPQAGDVEVSVRYSGISTGTERMLWDGTMPPFPGLSYPLVPGYETVGVIVKTFGPQANAAGLELGDLVFVPGSYSFQSAQNIFGGSASRLFVAHDRVVKLPQAIGIEGVLFALAATCYHALSLGGQRWPLVPPDLIVGHGVMGRLLARIVIALGLPAPTVWETQVLRSEGARGYSVIHPDEDNRRDYRAIYDVSGDSHLLNTLIGRLKMGATGEVCLAGFYKNDLTFAYAPAFMRETQIRIAAQWKKHDLDAISRLVHEGNLPLDDLITHTEKPTNAQTAYQTAFSDPRCLKMVLDWTGTTA